MIPPIKPLISLLISEIVASPLTTLNKLDWEVLQKEEKWKKAYPNLALRMERLEDRVEILEAALDNLVPERRQGAD